MASGTARHGRNREVRSEIEESKEDAPTRAPKVARRCVLPPPPVARVSVASAEVVAHHLGRSHGHEHHQPRGTKVPFAIRLAARGHAAGGRPEIDPLARRGSTACVTPELRIANVSSPVVARVAKLGPLATIVVEARNGRCSMDTAVEVATRPSPPAEDQRSVHMMCFARHDFSIIRETSMMTRFKDTPTYSFFSGPREIALRACRFADRRVSRRIGSRSV
jgi:hypothetical protein